jgi:hypothetical protein
MVMSESARVMGMRRTLGAVVVVAEEGKKPPSSILDLYLSTASRPQASAPQHATLCIASLTVSPVASLYA